MRGSGKWISSMVGARRYLRRKAQYMKEIFMRGRNMEREFLSGKMGAIIREILYKENMKAEDCTTLQTKADNMKEIS